METDQHRRFREAVERKSREAEEASKDPGKNPRRGDPVALDVTGETQPGIQTDDRGNQDVFSTRDKSSGHGKKTADKWSQ